jgi:hypothetical protein
MFQSWAQNNRRRSKMLSSPYRGQLELHLGDSSISGAIDPCLFSLRGSQTRGYPKLG